jgi:hypothetical protein
MYNECYHANENKDDNDNNKDDAMIMIKVMKMVMMIVMMTVVWIKEIYVPHVLMLSRHLCMRNSRDIYTKFKSGTLL